MVLRAVLLVCRGLDQFDPQYDWLYSDRITDTSQEFLTWRKAGSILPAGSEVAISILSEATNQSSLVTASADNLQPSATEYLVQILPRIDGGYSHSEHHRLLAPPISIGDLVRRLQAINTLYFGRELRFKRSCAVHWVVTPERGLELLRYPTTRTPHGSNLVSDFYAIVDEIRQARGERGLRIIS